MKNSTLLKTVALMVGLVTLLLSQGCLGIVQFVAPDFASPGQSINTFVRVKPNSIGEQDVNVGIYFSTDSHLDREDILMNTRSTNLADGQTHVDVGATFNLPANLNNGEYFLIAAAYYTNDLTIFNAGQNLFYRKITIVGSANSQPDLMLADVFLGGNTLEYYSVRSHLPGASVSVTFSVLNQGIQPTGNTNLRMYISRNANFSLSDPTLLPVNDMNVPAINFGQRAELIAYFAVPTPTVYGRHYLHLVVDAGNGIVEANEGNNIASRTFDIREKKEDHYVRNLASPGLILGDQPFSITYLEGINSRIGIYSSRVGVYLSTDATFSADDLLLASMSHNSSGTTTFYERTNFVTVPGTVSSGTYYLLVQTNPNNTFAEYNLTNNTSAVRLFLISNSNLTEEDLCTEFTQALEQSTEEQLERSTLVSKISAKEDMEMSLSIYPNPASETVTLSSTFQEDVNRLQVELIDATGKTLQYLNASDVPAGKWHRTFDLRLLPAGTYFVRLSGNKDMLTKTLIVK